MKKKLSDFISALESLNETIEEATINADGFQAHGWNQVHLKKEHIHYLLKNYINKLEAYGDLDIPEGLDSTLENHTDEIQTLNITAETYFTDAATHLIHIVPSILLTLQTIFSDVDYELFSYENIQNKKLLPRGLSTRLRSTSKTLDSIDETSSTLKEKITVINEAHEAAESLPTDLASLQDAKKILDTLITTATGELADTKKELALLKETSTALKNDVAKASETAEISKEDARKSAETAAKLVEKCDEALQITTTEGLAAGFDQRAVELKNSIWVWVVGLLIALGAGAWIGAERVEAFTQVLGTDLTAGQAILHTIMSIFSIGGPLWLAWISTQQINQRFKLSEDYSYKATVAKAFTGFKKLAERFDPATEERLFNSTLDRLDEMPLRLIEGKDYNSPWHEFTDSESFKTAIAMFPTLAKEAGKFATKTSLKKQPKQPKQTKSKPDIDNKENAQHSQEEKIENE